MPNISIGFKINLWGKTAELLGHIWLSYNLFGCLFQLGRASAHWADSVEAWFWSEFDSCCSALVWSEYSVVMRGEERDAEATLVHATYIQYTICWRGRGRKKHLHCTLGNSTPIFFLLTINHYQWVVKIKWCFPMAAGKEIHQKCVTGHKETWGKQQKRTKHDRAEHTLVYRHRVPLQ